MFGVNFIRQSVKVFQVSFRQKLMFEKEAAAEITGEQKSWFAHAIAFQQIGIVE